MIAIVALVALAAFTVEGAIGFGGTVIAVSLGAQLLPLDVLLPAFVPVSIALSLSLLRGPIAWRVLLVQIAPLVAVGIAAGVALSHVLASRALLVVFGAFVVTLSIWQLAGPTRRLWSPPLLALGGLVHGLFGTGGPMIVYVVRTEVPDKTAFRATLAVLWIALNTVLVLSFVAVGR
ncbi:MAG TPA: TSUP family transporter, partial [Kofleriaceae bacterium]|nr:TSUP family transporter [Kofleriaceae bacterium]